MRVLILANGQRPSHELAQRLSVRHDLLIATDGAAHHAVALGLSPDIICGDFDSIQMATAQAAFPRAEFIVTPDQERADLEKALHLARDRGAQSVTITGAAGGRIDHALANFALLLRYHTEFPLCIVDDASESVVVSGSEDAPGEHIFSAAPGDIISALSFDGRARVTIIGARWPLEDYQLPIGTQGISNVAISEAVRIQVRGGALLLCRLDAPDSSSS